MGIEEVVPAGADLGVVLQLLPRASTGERMNPYTSMWTGVTPGDGPRQVHLVLLDNGRTAALADEVGRPALACIRCSACLNVCPVYERVGGHAYGSVYPGPIGAVLSPLLTGVEDNASLPFASTLCGACYDACPVKIHIPSILVHLRARHVEEPASPSRLPRPLAPTLAAGVAAGEPVRRLTGGLSDYGATVRICGEPGLAATVAAALADRGARRLVLPPDLDLALPDGLERVADDGGLSAAELDACDGVITTAALAIAETGTIVLDGSPGQGRRALSLIPDYHLCVVRADQVVGLVPQAVALLSPVRPLPPLTPPSPPHAIYLH